MSPRIMASGAYFPFDADLLDRAGVWKNDVGVDVASLREFGSKFGGGVGVEPAITNIMSQSDFDTNFVAWNATDGNNATTSQSGGWRRIAKQGPTVTNAAAFTTVNRGVTAGTRYTMSFIFRSDAATPPTFIFAFFGNASQPTVAATVISLGRGVFWAGASMVIEASNTVIRGFEILSISWGSNTFMDAKNLLTFQHAGVQASVTVPIISSHVWGARGAGVLKYPGALLPITNGTISCWIRPNFDLNAFTTSANYILFTEASASPLNYALLYIGSGGSEGLLSFEVAVGGSITAAISSSAQAWPATALHHVAVTWSNVEQVLYINGVRKATRSGNFTRWSQGTWVMVGGSGPPASVGNQFDGAIDDLAILSRQLTDAQIAALFRMGHSFTGEASLAAAGLI